MENILLQSHFIVTEINERYIKMPRTIEVNKSAVFGGTKHVTKKEFVGVWENWITQLPRIISSREDVDKYDDFKLWVIELAEKEFELSAE
jgi:hypothetical protein|tara:strand:+ start:668 stop:937 length:270 start_codon:yes stop_codon:yes gene_type:complete